MRQRPRTSASCFSSEIQRPARGLRATSPARTSPEAISPVPQRAAYIKFKPAISPDGLFTKEGAENTLKFLATFNPAIKPSEIKLDQTFDNSYVQKALAKYKK